MILKGKVILHGGDNREVLKSLADNSIDAVVTDPPYALVSITKRFGKDRAAAYTRASKGFMGKTWDNGETAFAVEFWQQIYRVLKPGGHVVSFSGTRTYHRMACAIEDAGFEIRDQLQWLYGAGFPKSHNVSKGIDRHNGDAREQVTILRPRIANMPTADTGATRPWLEKALANGFHVKDGPSAASAASAAWDGWGTALKPAVEPICLARKPLIGTVAENVMAHGTGALNIGGTRIGTRTESTGEVIGSNTAMSGPNYGRIETGEQTIGRWPANILHDGSDEVVNAFPSSNSSRSEVTSKPGAVYGNGSGLPAHTGIYGFDDSGSAARFFYSAKADAEDRSGSKHPTVKPVDLMQWLCRLITPPGGTVLDPFAGSGSTGEAAWREGFNCILIEREDEYLDDIRRRLKMADQGPVAREHSRMVALGKVESHDSMPLFGGGRSMNMTNGRQIYGKFADQLDRLDSNDDL
jgi:site-specific DNA-methyltransferase (adenine-specific)